MLVGAGDWFAFRNQLSLVAVVSGAISNSSSRLFLAVSDNPVVSA